MQKSFEFGRILSFFIFFSFLNFILFCFLVLALARSVVTRGTHGLLGFLRPNIIICLFGWEIKLIPRNK